MTYLIVFLIILMGMALNSKASKIQKKIDTNEAITTYENLIYNIVTGAEKIRDIFIAVMVGFIIPFCILFIPSAFVLVQMAVQVSNDLIIPAVIIAAVISLLIYSFMAIVIISEYKKSAKKNEEINKEYIE